MPVVIASRGDWIRRINMKRFFLAFSLVGMSASIALSQGPTGKASQNNTTKASQPANKSAASANKSAQPMDTEYTDSIKKNTTDKMFLTELVDHLPLSAKVPSPAKVLGYPVGTPGKLTYTADLYRYYRELEKASPRVKTFVAPEKSEEGREQMLVVISDETNLAKLARYKEITSKLADPRNINDDAAKQFI